MKKKPVDLFALVRWDDDVMLRAAIFGGENIHIKDAYHTTLVMHAAKYGSMKSLEILLDEGVNINEGGPYSNALVVACKERRVDVMRYLIKRGARIAPSFLFQTIFNSHTAYPNEPVDLVRELVQEHAQDVNGSGGIREIPIVCAWERGLVETVKALIELGASVAPILQRESKTWGWGRLDNEAFFDLLEPYADRLSEGDLRLYKSYRLKMLFR
jgi:hypothetical protein